MQHSKISTKYPIGNGAAVSNAIKLPQWFQSLRRPQPGSRLPGAHGTTTDPRSPMAPPCLHGPTRRPGPEQAEVDFAGDDSRNSAKIRNKSTPVSGSRSEWERGAGRSRSGRGRALTPVPLSHTTTFLLSIHASLPSSASSSSLSPSLAFEAAEERGDRGRRRANWLQQPRQNHRRRIKARTALINSSLEQKQ